MGAHDATMRDNSATPGAAGGISGIGSVTVAERGVTPAVARASAGSAGATARDAGVSMRAAGATTDQDMGTDGPTHGQNRIPQA
jgi:hypothetical protein